MSQQHFEDRGPADGSTNLPIVADLRQPYGVEVPAVAEESLDWRRYLSAILRHRWWVLGATIAGAVAGVGGARLLHPQYQVQTTIWIQSEPRGGAKGSAGPIGSNQLFESSAWVDLLRSYVVLDQVARDLRLYLRPEPGYGRAFASFQTAQEYRPGRYRFVVDREGRTFRLLDPSGAELQHGAVGDSVGQALGFQWAPATEALPAGSDVWFVVRPLRDAARDLGAGLTVAIDENGNFLRVSLTGQDGARAAGVLNAVAHRYVEVATELKRAKLTELAHLLTEQLAAANAGLQRAESAYDAFRVKTITLAPDPAVAAKGAGPGVGDFFSLKLEQDQLGRDAAAIRGVLAQAADSGAAIGALAFIGAVQRSPDLEAALRELTGKRAERRVLSYTYTDDHPAVRHVTAQIDELEHVTIPSLALALAGELTAQQRALGPRIASGSRELEGIPQRTIEEARLRRDMDMAGGLYSSVQQRLDEARLAAASSVADVRVLDMAVAPQEPVQDRSSRLIVMGFAAGLGLGLAGAVLSDRMDPRMRYPLQVTNQMGLPILGVLPHVKDRGAGPDDEHVAYAIEAMRSVRLSLTHAYGPTRPMVVTVSSPGAGDGKSLVSANLALAYAELGQRTLLIDGDVRRGGLHHALNATRRPGLTDLLSGSVELDAVTQATSWPSLQFIATGTRFRDAPELLASPALVDLFRTLRPTYDVIIVDSPPLGSGVDPYTLGTATGSLLLVLRTGTTNLELARTKLATFEHLPVRLLGVVVNDVQPGGVYRYYSYLSGYGTADEGTALPSHRVRGVL